MINKLCWVNKISKSPGSTQVHSNICLTSLSLLALLSFISLDKLRHIKTKTRKYTREPRDSL